MNDMLIAIRKKLADEQPKNDEDALSLIAEEVFASKWAQGCDYDHLKEIIDIFFYKTRTTLNILQPLVDDDEITEIMVNGYDKIFFEKKGKIERYNLSFDTEEELEEVMQNIASEVHREVNELHPIVDARLADGSRVNGVYKNIAVTGPTLTIRKFSRKHLTIEQLVQNETLTPEAAWFLKLLVQCRYNLFISGGTSSGKTTLVNALSQYIGGEERVIVIEDSTELKLDSITNLIQMECRHENAMGKGEVSMSDLIKTSLRMRPDRIIVGEVRGKEVMDMLQAMNTGHDGSMSTGHGNSIEGMLKRLEAMYLMAVTLDVNTIREQIAEGIDFIIHVDRTDKYRKVVEISEVTGVEAGAFELNAIMKMNEENKLKFTGNCIMNTYKLQRKVDENIDELQRNGLISS